YQVTLVINITDVDDKLIVEAKKQNTTVPALAERVTADYVRNLEKLNVTGIDQMPRATQYIGDILAMIQGLIDKGYAYAAGGDVYFDVTKDDDYGKLCNRDPEQLEAGARIEVSELKRNPGDFALWKGAKPGEPQWESPWGPRRPIDYSEDRLEEVRRGLDGFYRFFERYQRITRKSFYELQAPKKRQAFDLGGTASEFLTEVRRLWEMFLSHMDDDFNTGGAIGVLFELLTALNRFADARQLES